MQRDDVQALLRARDEIDERLRSEHTREFAIVFSDLVGSTALFDSRGDIEGLSILRRYRELLKPVVERHRGWVVKTIGDALMAAFESPADAVRAAGAVQRALAEARAGEAGPVPLHARIGLHAGRVLLDQGDVFGDAVNIAARLQGEARKDEVILSRALYEQVSHEVDMEAFSRGHVSLKGKPAPVSTVSLRWGPQAPAPPEEDARDGEPAAAKHEEVMSPSSRAMLSRPEEPHPSLEPIALAEPPKTSDMFSIEQAGILIKEATELVQMQPPGVLPRSSRDMLTRSELFDLAREVGVPHSALQRVLQRRQGRTSEVARRRRKRRGFWKHLSTYLVVNGFFLGVNVLSWDDGGGEWWFYWPALAWGVGLALHAVSTFLDFGSDDDEDEP